MYLGRILSMQDREGYLKVIIGTEVGYETRYITIRTLLKSKFMDLKEQDQVIYTGYEVETNHKVGFKLESIMKKDFITCELNLLKICTTIIIQTI